MGLVALCGCADRAPHTPADSQAAHVAQVAAAGGVVDSIHTMTEWLHRFRKGMSPPDSLRHAAGSRDALVRTWLTAVSRRDTSTLNALVFDRAEFAFLYFPTSPMASPPYEAPPQLLWGQILASSNAGVTKMLRQFGGRMLSDPIVSCPDGSREGDNTTWTRCRLRFTVQDSAQRATHASGQFFGTIVERGGRYKFLGYANRL